jgi:hypothetical protein
MPKISLDIPEAQFKAMVNMKLLMFPQIIVDNNPIGQHHIRALQCQQCRNITEINTTELNRFEVGDTAGEIDLRFHSLNCRSTSSIKIIRHNLIVRELLMLFKSLKLIFSGEKQLQNTNHRLDATVVLQGESTTYLDITIVNPACYTYVRTLLSDQIELATATNAEARKREKYAPILGLQVPIIDMSKFVPFVIETTGRFGKEAESFLKKLKQQASQGPETEYIFRRFKTNVWKIIARGNSMCFLDFHKQLRTVLLDRPIQ